MGEAGALEARSRGSDTGGPGPGGGLRCGRIPGTWGPGRGPRGANAAPGLGDICSQWWPR